jgi:isoleucyl-tRNA synthetase
VPIDDMLPLDRYAVDLAAGLDQEIRDAYSSYRFLNIYQRLHHFCSSDMGAFYLDVIKDRLYTLPEGHPARRSAQTAMHHILEALVRWLAPICSFTAEEIWAEMGGDRDDSVMLATWYEDLVRTSAEEREFWSNLRAVREAVGPHLEALRRGKEIGSSLAAEITLEAEGALADQLAKVGDELRFIFISSDVHLGPAGEGAQSAEVAGQRLRFSVRPTEHAKCVRCWHHRDSVGQDDAHPALCGRCVENVEGAGETRRWG